MESSHPQTSNPSPKPNSHKITIKGKNCPICLTKITGHRPAIIANCNHAYCLRCLLRWSHYKRVCPLCNSPFDSYFSPFSSSSSSPFRLHRLLPPPAPPRPAFSRPVPVQRVLRRTREEINGANRRSRPVPHRRSFGRLGSVSSEVIQERILQWRASIYKLGLRAVPFPERNSTNLNMTMSNIQREAILHRIEPWVRRELQAVLQDPDPTIIVHVVTSLYLSSIEKKFRVRTGSCDNADTTLALLRPFLHEWTDTFWHELRCYAESSFAMNTYDEVVEYRKSMGD